MNPVTRIYPLILPILFLAPSLHAQWLIQYTTPSSFYSEYEGFQFRGIQATSESVVHAVAGSADASMVFRSTNEGLSWEQINFTTSYNYKSSSWVNDSVGNIVATRGASDSAMAVVLRTNDGGFTWREIYTTPVRGRFEEKSEFYSIQAAHFFDEETGIVVGSQRISADDYAIIRRTTDGGVSWITVQQKTTTSTGTMILPYSDEGGYVLLSGMELLKTTDRGITWSTGGSAGTIGTLKQLQFTSEMVGYRINSSNVYYFSKTTDGGMSWKQMNNNVQTGIAPLSPGNPTYNAFYFINDSVGYLTGSHPGFADPFTMSSGYYMLRTETGGFSWTRDLRNGSIAFDSARINGMHFITPEKGWATTVLSNYTYAHIWHRECLHDSSFIRHERSLSFDEGDSAILSLPEYREPVRYFWSTGDTTRSIVAKDSGRYTGSVYYDGGCGAIDTIWLNVRTALQFDKSVVVLCDSCSIFGVGSQESLLFEGCSTNLLTRTLTLSSLDPFAFKASHVRITSAMADANSILYAAGIDDRNSSVLYRCNPDKTTKIVRLVAGGNQDEPPQVIDAGDGSLWFVYISRDQDRIADMYIEKVASDGTVIHSITDINAGLTFSRQPLIGLDGMGSLYVLSTTGPGGGDCKIQKILPSGERAWSRIINASLDATVNPTGLLVNSDGSIVGTGIERNQDRMDSSRRTFGVDNSGTIAWNLTSVALNEDLGVVLPAPEDGFYLAQSYSDTNTGIWFSTISSYGKGKELRWTKSSDDGELHRLASAATDHRGSLYVAGPTSSGLRFDRYDPDGSRKWSHTDSRTTDCSTPVAMSVLADGALIVMHRSEDSSKAVVCCLSRYNQLLPLLSSVADNSSVDNATGTAIAIAPNPATGDVQISFTLSHAGVVSLALYDAIGSQQFETPSWQMEAGIYQYSISVEDAGLHSGVYYAVLKTEAGSATAQCVIVR